MISHKISNFSETVFTRADRYVVSAPRDGGKMQAITLTFQMPGLPISQSSRMRPLADIALFKVMTRNHESLLPRIWMFQLNRSLHE
jgi:hypothetical protein